jgi:hypothetical protein
VLQQKLHQKGCTENKTMCHIPRDEACSSVWYLDGLQIVLFEAVLSKEEPDTICSTGEGEEGKWWEAQDKSVKKRQADVPSEEGDDSEKEPMSIGRKRKVTKTGGKRESKRLKAEQD